MERDLLVGLVKKAQAGDSAAVEELFAAFYNDVYYFALKTVKDGDIACDITQEVFLEIIKTVNNLKEPAAFVKWMKQITYHQCTRYFKKKKDVLVEEDEEENSVFDTLADESEGALPAEVYEQDEFRRTVLAIINELTEEQRSAVMMYYFDELSIKQIAEIQGVSEGTVKSRLNYARKALKKYVESYEKEHNVKLHSFGFLPLFKLFFTQETMPAAKFAEVHGTVSRGAIAAAKAAALGGAGLGAKIAAMPLVTKIIAGAVAAAIAIGGVAAAFGSEKGHHCEDNDLDCICDDCGNVVHHGNPELSHDAFCAVCGASLGIHDENRDNICDDCGEYPCGEFHREPHSFADGLCEYCGTADEQEYVNEEEEPTPAPVTEESEPATTEYICYVDGDTPAAILTIANSGTFQMEVDLGEGFGTISGSYTVSDGKYFFTTTGNDGNVVGFMGDNFNSFSLYSSDEGSAQLISEDLRVIRVEPGMAFVKEN